MGDRAIPVLTFIHTRDYTIRRPRADAIAALLPRFGLAHIPRLLQTRLGREAIVAMGPSAIPALVSQVEREAKYYSAGSMPMGATFALSKITPGGLEAVLDLTRHAHPMVRYAAVAALGGHDDERAKSRLLECLEGPDADVRREAADAFLSHPDPRAIPGLRKQLSDSNPWNRQAAVAALGKMYAPELRPALAGAARSDWDARVRSVAAIWLIQSGDPVARRLGRRYQPLPIDERPWIDALIVTLPARGGLFVLTSIVFYWLCILGVERHAAITLVGALGVGLALGGAVPWMSAVVEYFLLLFWMPLTFLVCWRAGGRVRLGPAPWLVTGIVLVGTLLLVAVARATLIVGLGNLALGVPSWLLIWWSLFFLIKAWIAGEKVRDRRTLERLLLGGARRSTQATASDGSGCGAT